MNKERTQVCRCNNKDINGSILAASAYITAYQHIIHHLAKDKFLRHGSLSFTAQKVSHYNVRGLIAEKHLQGNAF